MAFIALIQKFLHSLVGQFLIGGFTVGGIAYVSNNLNNTALAGLIAAMPIGMPSTIFVDDAKVKSYSQNLLLMSFLLIFCTFLNWYFLHYTKMGKYKSVAISLATFWIVGFFFVYFTS